MKISQNMSKYVNKYFEEQVPEDILKEDILFQNPVPDNHDPVKQSDNFLRDILKEKCKANKHNIENVLEKLQRKTVDLMGLLSKLQNVLEGAKEVQEVYISKYVQISININCSITLKRQTVLLLEQSTNAIT